ncbi:MAG TPA: cytochrome P450 [Candidatus Binatia bacterium]|nr:cytochrome P450 [Candidatus Binatia bacterium]
MLRIFQTLVRWEWPLRALRPLVGPFNPFLREFQRDPYPAYRRLQARDRPLKSPLLGGGIVLARYDDVVAALTDARLSVDRTNAAVFRRLQPFRGLSDDFVAGITSTLLMLDPPAHTRLRRLVNKAFTPRVVETLRPRIQAQVDELLDRVRSRRAMDLVRDLAVPLPVTVIAELLGVPIEDRAHLKEWSDALAVLLDPLQAAEGLAGCQRAYDELATYMRAIFAARRAEPRDDLISALVAVEEQGQTLSETELLSLVFLILGAGHETTTNLIGNAVLALLRHPAERRRLQDDPSLVDSAVEEFLRFDSPVQATDRVAAEEAEVAGVRIRRGAVTLCLLGAANRDPARFPDADRLDLGRRDNHHLAFGQGAHFCLGAALARAEAQIAIATLLRELPDLDGDRSASQWRRSMVLRGPTSLALSW